MSCSRPHATTVVPPDGPCFHLHVAALLGSRCQCSHRARFRERHLAGAGERLKKCPPLHFAMLLSLPSLASGRRLRQGGGVGGSNSNPFKPKLPFFLFTLEIDHQICMTNKRGRRKPMLTLLLFVLPLRGCRHSMGSNAVRPFLLS